ncbi:DegV family protein [Athalassotoga saccharophila]|uniref:DegV family protein n=1 Tax=Athalassotoga saccharophila TaxID=1441386 RepID=UPI00137ACAE0|nr:DegV family protein [Athalassotoga saccharophila]BBJ29001.1 degV domain-containing protein [Athalassotoga saccharophila]
MKIKVITDSSCDLPPEWFKENDVEIVNLKIYVDGELKNISTEELLNEWRNGKKITTSQPTPNEFEKIYESFLRDYDGILSVHLSSKLSGTFNSAAVAARKFSQKVEVIDSLTTTSALGAMVAKAVELSKKEDLQSSAQKLRGYAQNVKTIFGVQTVENLVKGGRAHLIAGKLVTLLNVKPVLKGEDGEIKLHKIVLGFQRVLKEIVNYTESHEVVDGKIYIAHVNAKESVEYLLSKFKDKYTCTVAEVDPAIALNSGEGSVLVGFLV